MFGFVLAQSAISKQLVRDPIEGDWILDSIEWNGESTDQNLTDIDMQLLRFRENAEKFYLPIKIENHQSRLSFHGGRFEWRNRFVRLNSTRYGVCRDMGEYRFVQGTYPRILELRFSAWDAQFDDEYGTDTEEPSERNDSYRCIVSVEKDVLRCGWLSRGEGKVPVSFNTAGTENIYVFVYRRAKR